jgi:hypothetical protein
VASCHLCFAGGFSAGPMANAYNNIGQDELNSKFNFDAAFKVRA